jgi:hypothetical protein
MSLFGDKKIKATYFKKKKELVIGGLSRSMVNFLIIVGDTTIKRSSGKSVTVDISKVSDVKKALDMIEIVSEVKE